MTLRFLLDTSIVSAPVSARPNADVVRKLGAWGHLCAIGAPVWHELTYGCRRLPRGKRRIALEAYLEEVVHAAFPVLPYDEAAAAWHGAERARLEAAGKTAPFVDGQIAAIAASWGLALVTMNPKDFALYRELDVQDWSKRGGRA